MKTPWETAAVGKEFSHQTALFQWAAMARSFGDRAANEAFSYTKAGYAKELFDQGLSSPMPELEWLHAIKNQGHGDAIRGARSAAEGVRPGVFDVFLPVMRPSYDMRDVHAFEGGYPIDQCALFGGLYVELKRPGKNKVSDAQEAFQAYAREAGYAAEIVVGWEAARDVILRYLGRA